MRRIFSALIFLFLALSIAAAQGRDDRKQHDLVGPVKTVVVGRLEYTLKNGRSVAGKRIPNHMITFDEAGNKTEEVSYDPNSGSITSKAVYAYNKEGRLKSYESYSSAVDKTLSTPQKNEYKLDDKGNVIEQVNYQSDGTLGSRFLYKYDAKGNKTEEIFYGRNGSRMGKLLNTYDEAGHQLTTTSYNEDDSISWKIVVTYNTKGNKTEWVQYLTGILRYRITYNYDDKSRVIEQETFEYNKTPNLRSSHAPVPGKIIYTYNDTKRTKEIETYNEDGSLKDKMIYLMDERGNEVGWRTFNADGSPKETALYWYDKTTLLRKLSGIETANIEYDPTGNWIKKVRLIKSADAAEPEAYSTEYRDITYY
jgi:hypothetical protein